MALFLDCQLLFGYKVLLDDSTPPLSLYLQTGSISCPLYFEPLFFKGALVNPPFLPADLQLYSVSFFRHERGRRDGNFMVKGRDDIDAHQSRAEFFDL